MWYMIPSLQALVQALAPAFSCPAFHTHCQLLLGWLLCPSRHTLYRIGQVLQTAQDPGRPERQPFDSYYNFFSRSAWTVTGLACCLLYTSDAADE